MDLIVDFLASGGFDVILAIVNHFMRGAIFIPTRSNITEKIIANTFFDHSSVRRGFLPLKFITDRDSRLIKRF